MPYWPRLIALLLAAPDRVSAAGEIELTTAEADLLRACGFSDAGEGQVASSTRADTCLHAGVPVPPRAALGTRGADGSTGSTARASRTANLPLQSIGATVRCARC